MNFENISKSELKDECIPVSVRPISMAEIPKNPARSSICLIRWWFGEFPAYMDCILRSCAGNPDIDWLILTDNRTPRKFPPNVHIKHTSLDELRALFSAKLGFAANLPASHSLHTFKPAFGYFFEEPLKDYDFWGYCDFDMIFGDLRKFLREDILAAHDKILCRGHLTLYRNIERVNKAFMLDCPGALNYRDAFQAGKPGQFDEWRGINLIFRYHNIPQFHDEFIVDVAPPTNYQIKRFEGIAIRNHPEQLFYWHQGKFFHAYLNSDRGINDDEYAYIHFQKRPLPAPGFDPFAVNGFLITPQGFFPYNREPLTPADFARHNQTRWRTFPELLRAVRHSVLCRFGVVPPENAP
jgi:hypothetical protein